MQHSLFTENNLRLHENEISKPLSFQPHCCSGLTISSRRKQLRGDIGTLRTDFEEDEKLLDPVGTGIGTVTPNRKIVQAGETLRPLLLVPLAGEGELQDSFTNNDTQNNTNIQSENVENSKQRSSVSRRAAKPPNSYGAMGYW